MKSAINWQEQYTETKERIVYTKEQHHIPGVGAFGHHLMTNAFPSLPWHYHENSFEFCILMKGSITFSTRTSSYKFSGGDVFLTYPNEIHGTNQSPITVGDLFWFQLDISDPEHFLFLTPAAASKMISWLLEIPHHVIQIDTPEIYPLLKNAFRLLQKGTDSQVVATYLEMFLHLVILHSNNQSFRLSPDIGRSLNYIIDHICDNLTLEELASIASLSCSQYKQKFKKQIGISPRHFINQQKIEHAKLLLQEGTSVTDTAMQLGFTTSNYFSSVFKKYTLCTPAEYANSR